MASVRWLPILAAAVVLGACSSSTPHSPPPPPCPDGTVCHSSGAGNNGVGAGTGGSDAGVPSSGSGGGGGEAATVTGTVVSVNSLGFDSASPYSKAATIRADGPSGKQLSQAYDGSPFTIDGVAPGSTWFLVTPKDSSDTVFPTYSLQPVPAAGLELPVLDQEVLSSVGLDAQLALDPQRAQIVLRVTDGSKPLAGVSATSAGAGQIVYDLGPASYSAQVAATADRGIIVLLNYQSVESITLTDASAHTYTRDVRAVPGTATLLDITLAP